MNSIDNEKAGEAASQKKTKSVFRTIGTCAVEVPRPCGLVIFGASGDLTKRKIIPSLYRLQKNRFLSENFFILGTGRTEINTDEFRKEMFSTVKNTFSKDFNESAWNELVDKIYYSPIDYAVQETYAQSLMGKLLQLEKKHQTGGNRIFYLAIPPTLYENVILNLGATDLSKEEKGYAHVVIEKPFGQDLDSAKRLNRVAKNSFQEKQIYRIDHYLALETVQNILMLRFANSIFEPLWNRGYIDHIQITASETLGVEHRAGYYEKAGVLRDMFQNHMFQLLTLTAMEPPVAFGTEPVRDEKIKVLNSVKPFPLDRLNDYLVVGQYGRGKMNKNPVPGYREEEGVLERSITPTFAAMKVLIDNWRWNGVPFYLRSGKRLTKRKTEISIHFRPVPHLMFSNTLNEPIEPNILVLRVHPDEGMNLILQTKNPGSEVCLNPISMDFSYQRDILMEAYEWVLLNCMHDDQLLFVREDAVEQTWSLLTPVIERLESATPIDKFPNYAAGSSGPEDADSLMKRNGRAWRPL
jgi:glucose-6-phosphate 1-dehydrogenase